MAPGPSPASRRRPPRSAPLPRPASGRDDVRANRARAASGLPARAGGAKRTDRIGDGDAYPQVPRILRAPSAPGGYPPAVFHRLSTSFTRAVSTWGTVGYGEKGARWDPLLVQAGPVGVGGPCGARDLFTDCQQQERGADGPPPRSRRSGTDGRPREETGGCRSERRSKACAPSDGARRAPETPLPKRGTER